MGRKSNLEHNEAIDMLYNFTEIYLRVYTLLFTIISYTLFYFRYERVRNRYN